jgi:hypothetical protein
MVMQRPEVRALAGPFFFLWPHLPQILYLFLLSMSRAVHGVTKMLSGDLARLTSISIVDNLFAWGRTAGYLYWTIVYL